MSTLAASSLGTRLRAEREHRGFTLEQVSASTKIPVAHLEALERDDLSRWPKGLYRRAFFRAYVKALGLPQEPLAAEFARLYFDEPAGESAPTADVQASSRASAPEAPPAPMSAGPVGPGVLRSLIDALVEGAAVLAVGALLGWATGMTLLTATGAVALVYYPSIRAGARRTRQSHKATLRPGESPGAHGRSPMPPPAQPGAVTASRLSAALRLRARLALVRTRSGQFRSHVARNWLPLARRMMDAASEGSRRGGTRAWHVMRRAAMTVDRKSSLVVTLAGAALWRARTIATYAGRKSFLHAQRIIDTASHGSRRAGTRAWHVMRRAAAATHRISSHVTWAADRLRCAGTVASDAARKSFLHAQRTIATASQGSRRAGTRTWHVLRRAAVATFRMSCSVAILATIVLWCAGTVASYVARLWFLRAKRMLETASQRSRQARIRAWHVMRRAAVTTYRMSSRVATWAGVVLWHAGTVASRALGRTARQTGRICLRGLLWANQVFWGAVRSAAGHAEQLAARQLNPKSEGPAMADFMAARGTPRRRSTLRPRPSDADERGDPHEDAEAGDLEVAKPGQDWIDVIIRDA